MFPSLIYDGTTFREESAVLFSSFELRESVISELKFHSGRIMSRGESEGVSEWVTYYIWRQLVGGGGRHIAGSVSYEGGMMANGFI